VVVMTLLLCAEAGDGPAAGGPESCSEVGDGPAAGGSESCGEVGDTPKPATVLLQKRNEKLKVEDTGMADGTRVTDGGAADLQEGILRMNKSQDPYAPKIVEGEGCDKGEVILREKCEDYAKDVGLSWVKGIKTVDKGWGKQECDWPAGCYWHKNKLRYNRNMSCFGGKPKVKAICAAQPPQAGLRVYKDPVSCPSHHLSKTKKDCISRADTLVVDDDLTYVKVETLGDWQRNDNYPPGCFHVAYVLWFNPTIDSPATCTSAHYCTNVICAGV